MSFPIDISRNSTGPEHRQLAAGQFVFNQRYRLEEKIGSGGMGEVWRAYDQTERTQVALKFLHTVLVHLDKEMESLRDQVREGKKLLHDRIVATYGLEMEGHLAAIVLEFVPGETLKQKLEAQERGFFEPREIEGWLADVTSALTYLHVEKKRLHRDIKPANIIVDLAGHARLMDFGISQSIQETMGRHSQTAQSQGTSNTLAYASPESLSPRHKPALSDDIYSLGATLYDLLTGTPPFYRGSPEVIALHAKTERVPTVMERRAELVEDKVNKSTGDKVDERWQALIAQCLDKAPAKRPAAADQVRVKDPTAPPPKPATQKKKTSPVKKALTAAAFIAVSLVAFEAWQQNSKHTAELEAQARAAEAREQAALALVNIAPEVRKPKPIEEKPTSPPAPTPKAIPVDYDDIVTFTIQGKSTPIPVTRNPAKATVIVPYANKLDMLFIPVPHTKILFCIHETRVKDFAAFVKATGYDASKDMISIRKEGYGHFGDTWESPGFSQTDDHCVCGVSAEDADAFCKWIGGGCRLPTDAEWSIAVGGLEAEDANASPKSKDGQIKEVYPWGAWPDSNNKPPPLGAGNYGGEESKIGKEPDNWTFIANYRDSFARTAPVCSFPPNRNGLYDLGGNVWEWTGSTWEKTSNDRVLRGASWCNDVASSMLSSLRGNFEPGYRNYNIGFRVVVVVSGG